jgi:hypothetical protein
MLSYADIFARHEYDVGQPLRRHPETHLHSVDQEFDRLLDASLISPCSSAWASNVVLVKRKSMPGCPVRMRVTIDLRDVDAKLERLGFPMPSQETIIDALAGHQLFYTAGFSKRLFGC